MSKRDPQHLSLVWSNPTPTARPTIPGPSPFLFALVLNFAIWAALIAVIIRTLNGGAS